MPLFQLKMCAWHTLSTKIEHHLNHFSKTPIALHGNVGTGGVGEHDETRH